jgi:NitT/TauT family transport system permease protein
MNFKSKFTSYLPAFFFLVLVVTILEFITRTGLVASYILPSPSQVLSALVDPDLPFFSSFMATLQASLKGFSISFMVAILLSIVIVLVPWLEKAILPFSLFFQTVPIVAIAPLLVIWFGLGEPTVVASSAIVSFFPMLANNLVGLKSIRKTHEDLFRLYKANVWQKLIYLRFPSAVSYSLTGAKIAAGLAVIGAIVGEFIAGGGLGGLIDIARTQQKIEAVFAAVILSSLIGLLYLFVIKIIELFLKRYLRNV